MLESVAATKHFTKCSGTCVQHAHVLKSPEGQVLSLLDLLRIAALCCVWYGGVALEEGLTGRAYAVLVRVRREGLTGRAYAVLVRVRREGRAAICLQINAPNLLKQKLHCEHEPFSRTIPFEQHLGDLQSQSGYQVMGTVVWCSMQAYHEECYTVLSVRRVAR